MTPVNANDAARNGDPGDRPNSATRGLPPLGRRGGGWVGLQVLLLCAAAAAGLLGARWPAPVRLWLAALGGVVILAGLGLLLGAGVTLGRQLTPFPRPISGGALRRGGVYAMVRHPMYGGALAVMLGWALLSSPLALLPLVLAAVFLDAKSRREEAWLMEQYPDYVTYRRHVRHRLLPWLW